MQTLLSAEISAQPSVALATAGVGGAAPDPARRKARRATPARSSDRGPRQLRSRRGVRAVICSGCARGSPWRSAASLALHGLRRRTAARRLDRAGDLAVGGVARRGERRRGGAASGVPTVAFTDVASSDLARAADEVVVTLRRRRAFGRGDRHVHGLVVRARPSRGGLVGDGRDARTRSGPRPRARALADPGRAAQVASELASAARVCVRDRARLRLSRRARVVAQAEGSGRAARRALLGGRLPAWTDRGRHRGRASAPDRRSTVPRAATSCAGASSCARAARASCAPPTTVAGDLIFPPGPEWLAPIPAAIVGQRLALRAEPRARARSRSRPPGLTKITRTR